MTPATWPRGDRSRERLLRIDPAAGTLHDARVSELPALLRPGDLLVVNDAATLPASLSGRAPDGQAVEVRLAGRGDGETWDAVLFGGGDWRVKTEDRPAPPRLVAGDVVRFGPDLAAEIHGVSPVSPRLLTLAFDRGGADLWSALYRHGRPVQYSYLAGPLALWHVQTAYGSRPWAFELPSAGRPLTFELLRHLRERGVEVAALTHAAGLSSTGDPALDAALPLPERFDIPAATVEAVEGARGRAGRVVAVGTTVVRALEGAAAAHGRLVPGPGVTAFTLDGSVVRRVTDGLLTGLHEPGSSHFALLAAFAAPGLLLEAWRHAEGAGYLAHEFGDSSLILAA